MVLPSLYEGFGLPAIEAMRSGAAVLVSDIPVLREISIDTEARFDPNSSDDIARVMLRAIEDAGFVDRIRRRGSKIAREFTWDRVAAASLGAYRYALGLRSEATRSMSLS
jgi:glycosyltransferase involved in cell wall biosynthesis